MIVSKEYGPDKWRLPPPVEGEWVELKRDDALLLASRLSESNRFSAQSLATVEAVRVARLDFYPGWMLCDFQIVLPPSKTEQGEPVEAQGRAAEQQEPVLRSYLYGPDGFTSLSGISMPIHEHNALHGLDISTIEKCKSYLRFFCFFIRGDMGPFELHESSGALDILTGFDEQKQRSIKSALRPIEVSKTVETKEGSRAFRGCVFYADQLFESDFLIEPQGRIEMLNDSVVAEGVRRLPPIGFDDNSRFLMRGPENKGGSIK